MGVPESEFLSIQAQDFIEEVLDRVRAERGGTFLSIQAQDFIEDREHWRRWAPCSNS